MWNKRNDWENAIAKIITKQKKPWQWKLNPNCKYFELRIDTRDGGAVISNRFGNVISIDELLDQTGKGGGSNIIESAPAADVGIKKEPTWYDRSDWIKAIGTILSGFDNWCWTQNFDCKYVEFRIDTRDGRALIRNSNSEPINLDELLFQRPYKTDRER